MWSNQAVFRVVDFFCSVCQLVLSILSALFFLPSLHKILKQFPKFCQNKTWVRHATIEDAPALGLFLYSKRFWFADGANRPFAL